VLPHRPMTASPSPRKSSLKIRSKLCAKLTCSRLGHQNQGQGRPLAPRATLLAQAWCRKVCATCGGCHRWGCDAAMEAGRRRDRTGTPACSGPWPVRRSGQVARSLPWRTADRARWFLTHGQREHRWGDHRSRNPLSAPNLRSPRDRPSTGLFFSSYFRQPTPTVRSCDYENACCRSPTARSVLIADLFCPCCEWSRRPASSPLVDPGRGGRR